VRRASPLPAGRSASVRPAPPTRRTGPSLRLFVRLLPADLGLSAGQAAQSVVPCGTVYNVAIRSRMYPSAEHRVGCVRHCDDARFVWNLCVEQQSWWRPGRGSAPGCYEQKRQLTEARAAFPWLADGSSSVQQQAIHDFDHAMTAFFDKANPAGRPTFRSKRGLQGFVVRDTKVRRLNRRWGEVWIPKCGWVHFRWTRPLPVKLGMARVTLNQRDQWHVSFPSPQPAVARERTGKVVGIDRGVRTALVTSNGQHYRAPRISDRRAARYLGLQQRLARQQRKSAKRERTRRAMAVITARVADRRKDWAEKISTRLVATNDVIVLEKLNIKGMTKKPAPKPDPDQSGNFLPNGVRAKAGLNRGILASAWGTLGRRLAEKGAASDVPVMFVDPKFTSQQCRVCGYISPGNRESQAEFRCIKCGHTDHADKNAACNILARGLLLTTGELVPARAPGHGALRPHQSAQAAAGTTRRAA
jgi:putative transposase